MMKTTRRFLSVVAILSLVFGSFAMVSAVRGQQEQPAPIYLEAGTFIPGESEISTPPGLTIAGYPVGTRGYYIVQFRGPIEQALIGTPVKDPQNPVELGHVVRSFDPCLVCSVHILQHGQTSGRSATWARL